MLVSQKIRSLREKKGMSMTDLALATGITQTSISRYENGQIKKIDQEKLNKIAEVLDISLDELIKDDPVYSSNQMVRGPYVKEGERAMIHDDIDESLLIAFHQLSEGSKYLIVQLAQTIAAGSN